MHTLNAVGETAGNDIMGKDKEDNDLKIYHGKIAQRGIALGKCLFIQTNEIVRVHTCDNQEYSRQVFEKARIRADLKLQQLAKQLGDTDHTSTEIIHADRMLLQDAMFLDAVKEKIEKERLSAKSAVFEAGQEMKALLCGIGDQKLIARADDIMGVADSVIDCIREIEEENDSEHGSGSLVFTDKADTDKANTDKAEILRADTSRADANRADTNRADTNRADADREDADRNTGSEEAASEKSASENPASDQYILIAEKLSPEKLVSFDAQEIAGIVTKYGSALSHVSIIAGSRGIPYLYGIDHELFVHADKNTGKMMLLDAGSVEVKEGLLKLFEKYDAEHDFFSDVCHHQERDKHCLQNRLMEYHSSGMKVYANISGPEDLAAAKQCGAEGIGLFRTEYLFLNRESAPSEEEQFEVYKAAAETMKRVGEQKTGQAYPTVIRTADLGSDKTPSYMQIENEKNPALGMRGIRISLSHPQLFRVQLRALLRAAVYGDLRILLPMIISESEVLAVKEQIDIACRELQDREGVFKVPPIGIMIETPAAALMAEDLAKAADFFSIGSNDLTQYTMAMDREGIVSGAPLYTDGLSMEPVYRLIKMTVQAAHDAGITVSVCGELAADPQGQKRLIQMGIDAVSVSAVCMR